MTSSCSGAIVLDAGDRVTTSSYSGAALSRGRPSEGGVDKLLLRFYFTPASIFKSLYHHYK